MSDRAYQRLLRTRLEDLDSRRAVRLFPRLCDAAHDRQDLAGLKQVIASGEALLQTKLSAEQESHVAYCLGTTYANLADLRSALQHAPVDVWEQTDQERGIFYLRRALQSPGFPGLVPVHQAHILTNLANGLSRLGRFVEAIAYWRRGMETTEAFPMAMGNLARAYHRYAAYLYDEGHRPYFLRGACQLLKGALEQPLHETARARFSAWLEDVRAILHAPFRDSTDFPAASLGATREEQRYRKELLDRGLFLNPLNDLCAAPVAAADVLCLGSITTRLDEGPYLIAFFDTMKQEFVAARLLWYEAVTTSADIHFADRAVVQMNTMDYPSYSISTEKLKASFRIAYSILDKIAYLLNDYFRLGENPREVSFRKVWYTPNSRKGKQWAVRPEFRTLNNTPLLGLFGLSKDLSEEAVPQETLEPEARGILEIRNHAEHKFLRVHLSHHDGTSVATFLKNPLAHSIGRDQLERKTLHLLRLSRAALIHLSLAIEAIERTKRTGEQRIASELDRWEDEWKRE